MPTTPDPLELFRTVRAVAATPGRWLPLIDFDPVSRHYARISATVDRELWLLTWLPGQGTDWHDHGDSAGAFTVVAGELREETATPGGGSERRRGDVHTWGRGRARWFGTDHVHRVTNTGLEPAISLHAYSPRLTVMNRYEPVGDHLVPSGTELAGADW